MRQLTVVEAVLTYISIGWAYVLFTTPDLFDNNPNWSKFEAVVGYEWIVGILALVCAAVKIIGIALHHARLRWLGLLLSTFLWVFVAASFLIADDTIKLTTGFIAYSGLSVMSLWTSKEVMIRERAEQRGLK